MILAIDLTDSGCIDKGYFVDSRPRDFVTSDRCAPAGIGVEDLAAREQVQHRRLATGDGSKSNDLQCLGFTLLFEFFNQRVELRLEQGIVAGFLGELFDLL